MFFILDDGRKVGVYPAGPLVIRVGDEVYLAPAHYVITKILHHFQLINTGDGRDAAVKPKTTLIALREVEEETIGGMTR